MIRAQGWYADPQVPTQMRWWDGSAWTADVYARVEPPGGYLDETPSTQTDAVGRAPRVGASGPYAAPAVTTAGVATTSVTTEDGVALASWRRRAAARLIDNVVTSTVGLLLVYPVFRDMVRHLGELQRLPSSGGPLTFSDPQMLRALALIGLSSLLVGLVYEVAFLLWKAATPGKLLLGLRVRRWTPGERLGPSVIARRWLGYQGVGQIPTFGLLYQVVDLLWPRRDPRRQALHDKFAGTCVVRASRDSR